MIQGSSTCADVGIRSAAKTAVRPPDSIRTIWWCIVWPPVRHTLMPGSTSPSSSMEIDDAGVGSGTKFSAQVAGAIALVRVRGVVPLAAPDEVRARAGNAARAGRPCARREAAGVIEMQVRGDHDVDVVGASGRPPPAS